MQAKSGTLGSTCRPALLPRALSWHAVRLVSLRLLLTLLDSRAPFHSVAALRWTAELVVQSSCGCKGAFRSEECGTESRALAKETGALSLWSLHSASASSASAVWLLCAARGLD